MEKIKRYRNLPQKTCEFWQIGRPDCDGNVTEALFCPASAENSHTQTSIERRKGFPTPSVHSRWPPLYNKIRVASLSLSPPPYWRGTLLSGLLLLKGSVASLSEYKNKKNVKWVGFPGIWESARAKRNVLASLFPFVILILLFFFSLC
jgi:hypothetical protein